jgi:hypothetical protein
VEVREDVLAHDVGVGVEWLGKPLWSDGGVRGHFSKASLSNSSTV